MPSGVEVEDSITSNLVEMLRRRELNAFFKKSYATVAGRKEPDVTIETPSGLFLLEAKMPPNGLPHAMSQAGEYRETIGLTESIKGVFAVVYASGIKTRYEAWFAFDSRFDLERFRNLEDLAEWIEGKIREAPRPLPPVNTQKIIDILNESVALIAQGMQHVDASEIEQIFGGRDFFSTVLDYEQESHISDAALKNAASYLLLNQVLFYQILSNEVRAYPRIDARQLKDAAELHSRYFSHVLKDDYQPIFGFDVANTIKGPDAVSAVRTAISAIQLLSPEMLTHDLLGKIFHNLIPLSLRKTVAAYYTNSEAAELLADLAIEKKNDKVIDPACGSGTLLVASYNRKHSLYGRFEQRQHTRFLEHEIFGADIMPFAAHLAAVNLALQAPLSFTNTVNIAIRDSTELAPGTKIASAQDTIKQSYRNHRITDFDGASPKAKPKVKKGAIDLHGRESSIVLPRCDVVIMNPPFTRFQRIPPAFKAKLQTRFSAARYREIVHGRMGLHGYFLLLADKLLAPGGRMAAVLPLTTLSLEGFYGIIRLLLQDYSIEHVVASSGRAAFSENTSLREILLVARKEKPVPEHRIKFTFIHASPQELSIAKAHGIAEKVRRFDGEDATNDDFYIRQVNQCNLTEDTRSLYQTVSLHSPQLVALDEKMGRYLKVGQKFTTIGEAEKAGGWRIHESTKGVDRWGYYCLSVLGSEDKALKEHDVWVLDDETDTAIRVRHRFNGRVFRIPRNCVVNQFRRFPGQATIRLQRNDYVIIRRFDDFDAFLSASGLADAERMNAIKRNIREGRWEQFVIKNSSRVFGFYRGNVAAPGTSLFAARAEAPVFTGPGSSWSYHIPDEHDVLVSLWLNSSLAIHSMLKDRNETEGGFITVDKYLLSRIPYPRVDRIDVKTLAALERELSGLEFPSLLKQFQTGFEGRRKIDEFFLDYAGMPRNEQKRFLKLLYETMANELLRLKDVMGR